MLKRRVIPVLLLKGGLIVRSELFRYHQQIGDPTTQLRRYDKWQVDELIYIDITTDVEYDVRRSDAKIATSGKSDIVEIISEIARVCFVPLTFGGRIRTLDDIRHRLECGADKVTVNTAAHDDPSFVTRIAEVFGSQCLVISIDVARVKDSGHRVFKGGRVETDLDPVVWAREVEARGAGEILLNSIDCDGTANGYDLEVIERVASAVQIPVIALGGVGHWSHMADCLKKTSVAAVAAANKFHFTEMSYRQCKSYLLDRGVALRSSL